MKQAASAQQRPARRHGRPQRAPIRVRAGLAMRRDLDYGDFGDAEQLMAEQGVALAPMAVDTAAITAGGVTVLPTAGLGDLKDGALAALIVPAGQPEGEGSHLDSLIAAAGERGVPVIAFGEGVARAGRVLGQAAPDAAAPAVVFARGSASAVHTRDQLAQAAAGLN